MGEPIEFLKVLVGLKILDLQNFVRAVRGHRSRTCRADAEELMCV